MSELVRVLKVNSVDEMISISVTWVDFICID